MDKFLQSWISDLLANGFMVEKDIELYPDIETWDKMVAEIKSGDNRFGSFQTKGNTFSSGIVYQGALTIRFNKPITKAEKLLIIKDEINEKMDRYRDLLNT